MYICFIKRAWYASRTLSVSEIKCKNCNSCVYSFNHGLVNTEEKKSFYPSTSCNVFWEGCQACSHFYLVFVQRCSKQQWSASQTIRKEPCIFCVRTLKVLPIRGISLCHWKTRMRPWKHVMMLACRSLTTAMSPKKCMQTYFTAWNTFEIWTVLGPRSAFSHVCQGTVIYLMYAGC